MSVYKNSPPIVTSGLVIYYDPANLLSAKSGSSIVTDISYNLNISGSLTAATTYGTVSASINSNFGGTLQFDGTSSYVNLYNSASIFYPSGSAKSVFAWINPTSADSTGTGDTRIVYLSPVGSSNNFNLTISSAYPSSSANNTYVIGGTPDNNQHYGYSIQAFPLKQWAYVGWTFDGVNWMSYYNNTPYSSSNTSGGITTFVFSQTGFFIGSRINASTSFFNGLMGPIQMYNKGLSQAEVTQNYNAHKSRFNLQ